MAAEVFVFFICFIYILIYQCQNTSVLFQIIIQNTNILKWDQMANQPLIVIVLFLLCISFSQCIYMRMKDGHNKIVVNSSCNGQMFSLSLSSYGQPNSYFYMKSEVLSPNIGKHSIIHSVDQQKLIFEPPLKDEIIIFNDYSAQQVNQQTGLGQFWLALKHPVKQQLLNQSKDVHFIPLTISEERRTQNFLLPAFNQPFSFLPAESFYRCEGTLLSINQIDHYLDIAVFSSSKKQEAWRLHGKWDWTWRKAERGINYGRSIKYDKNFTISIASGDKKYCKFKVNELPPIPQNQQIWHKSYYRFEEVLQKAVMLEAIDLPSNDQL